MATVCPIAPLHQEANASRLKIRSVKTLAESSNLTSIPSHCAFTTSTSGDQVVHPDHDDSIPIIDFSLLSSSNLDRRSKVVSDLAKACQDWGFFMVINHGVQESQMKAMIDMLTGFFDLIEEEKREFQGKHVLDPIRCGTSFWRDFLKVRVHPKFHCPTKPEGFSEVLAEYSGVVRKLVRGLLKGISESLGLEPGYIDEAMNMDSSLQILAANLYTPCAQPELAMGVPPHADHGLLTILMQNGIGGLQVHHGGKWVKIDPIPNALLVNIADHLEIVSNGKYKSVLHRAVVNDKATRISIALSNGPSPDTVAMPAEQLVDGENNRAVHIGMKYKDYLDLQQSSVGLDGVITQPKLLDGVLTQPDLLDGVLDGVLTQPKLLDGVFAQPQLLDGVLTQPKLLDGVLTQPQLLDGVFAQPQLLDGVFAQPQLLDGVFAQPELLC